jgi:hypothetical protein
MPYLLSINPTLSYSIRRFRISVTEWISSTSSGRDERRGITLPLAFNIH